MRQALEPLAQQPVDGRRRQAVGELLHQRRVGTAQHAVVQRLEGDAALGELALYVLMPVDAQLRVVGEVRAELDEQRPEVGIDDVEVVVIHHRRRGNQPRVRAVHRILTPFRAHHARLLLGLADVEHPLCAFEAAQIRLCPLVLALEALETHQVDALAIREALDPRHKTPRHRRHQYRRRHRIAAHPAKESRRAAARLQQRYIDVQVHPVDALQFQGGVFCQHFAGISCYGHLSDSGRWAPHRPLYGHRRLGRL